MFKLIIFISLFNSLIFGNAYAQDCATKICRVYVISDLNGSYGSTNYSSKVREAIKFIINRGADLVISTGDHVAGQKRGLNYQAMWDSFHQLVTIPLSKEKIPFLPSPGNHDASGYSQFHKER